jgi:hypothetical protein
MCRLGDHVPLRIGKRTFSIWLSILSISMNIIRVIKESEQAHRKYGENGTECTLAVGIDCEFARSGIHFLPLIQDHANGN